MYRIWIEGTVQGVGFRPYIYKKAKQHGLLGSVRNTGNGVEIIIDDKDFLKKLDDLPPLCKISKKKIEPYEPEKGYDDFSILKSTKSEGETELPSDMFMCGDCLKELRDKKNRRHDYYFITCTNCGPRFSMIDDYPYDRPLTSMKEFSMCKRCKKEYSDPDDRRYHAQTIACKDCGPKLKLIDGNCDITAYNDQLTIKKAADLIMQAEFISVKGVGGFHICCRADAKSVRKVREFLGRRHKPFALMCKDIEMVKRFANPDRKETEELLGPKRPIVVLRKKDKDDFMGVSELESIGIMLPYTALHYLMFDFLDEPLVMTSCNAPGEPVALDEKLGRFFLTHERKIINRCDDSVIKIIKDTQVMLRRSRGYVPESIRIDKNPDEILCLGAELNNCICTAKNNKVFLSQYIGDISSHETFEFFKQAIEKLLVLTRVKPKKIICDLHPSYNSTDYAKELSKKLGASLIKVQHHKAHVASVAAEHGLREYVGIAMDGLGYGEDGKVWGGEVFRTKDGLIERAGHIEEIPMIGGDSATVFPRKMLYGIIHRISDHNPELDIIRKRYSSQEIKIYDNMLDKDYNISWTTSAGRVLDSAACLLGICDERTYEGRPAMLLESYANGHFDLEPAIEESDGIKILKIRPLFEFLLRMLKEPKHDKQKLAGTVQMYLAKGMLKIARSISTLPVVFSGGVAYNRMITSFMLQDGVKINKKVPAGDGGICLGQAYLGIL